jgi:fructoselysine-6-P-deglycase FrlB-like protein
MSHVGREIASQPGCWQRAAELASEGGLGLPRPGERVAAIGCGTSLYMAKAYARLRERAGAGETDAFAASELPVERRYDRVVAITRSGTTTEVLDALARLTTPAVAITAAPGTPVHEVASDVVQLGFADERSVVQTRFATSVLALLRAALGEDLRGAIADAERALAAELPARLLESRQFTFLGSGWTVGLADEAALKLREASLSWAESYPAMEYRHGPISITCPTSAVWFLGAPAPGLVEEIERTGALIVRSSLDPLAELVRVQRLAVALGEQKGLDPDAPRNLARSVVLDVAGA